MSNNELKLFYDRRLTATEPHHLVTIKSILANLKAENSPQYDTFSKFYGVELDVKITKEPGLEVKVTKEPKVEEAAAAVEEVVEEAKKVEKAVKVLKKKEAKKAAKK